MAGARFRNLTGLANASVVLFLVIGVLGLAMLGVGLLLIIELAGGDRSAALPQDFTALEVVDVLLSLGAFVVQVVCTIVFLIWLHHASVNARALGTNGLRISPGWAVGWWFVPFANLVKPFQAVNDLWRSADALAYPTADPDAWPSHRTPALLVLWWTCWLAGNSLGTAAARVSFHATTHGEMLVAEWIDAASDLFWIGGAALAATVVMGIQKRQMAALFAMPEGGAESRNRQLVDLPPPPQSL